MMSNDGNEKYAKAAKQSKQTLYGMIVVGVAMIVIIFGTALLSSNNANANVNANGSAMTASMMADKRLSTSGAGASAAIRASSNNHNHNHNNNNNNNANQQQQQQQQQQPQHSKSSYLELRSTVQKYDAKVRQIKSQVDIFETDPQGKEAALALQDATRTLLHYMYGKDSPTTPYRIRIDLQFQSTIPDYAEKGADGYFVIELAPSSLQPHSIYTFLEIARHWHGGAFHRVAPHVLQVQVQTHTIQHLAFQEYSPDYPHKQRTVGYAGRPSGPAWYVSTQDNSKNHGPGSQQKKNPYEADSCFGKVIDGYDQSVMRIRKAPGGAGMGFIGDAKKHVLITRMTIMIPKTTTDGSTTGTNGATNTNVEYVPWHDTFLDYESEEKK